MSACSPNHRFDAVIHFAGLKAVGESVAQPLRYYQNNVQGTLTLCDAMARHGVFNLVFSSSATVYGDPHTVPITEDFPLSATNPYGRSKLMVEEILSDLGKADAKWNLILLRYFNPVGAHRERLDRRRSEWHPEQFDAVYPRTGCRGQVAAVLPVFGNDYPTPDGTGMRDFIHVVDLAIGHLKALDKLQENPGVVAYNLGTGQGYSSAADDCSI